uniref:Uncharacterized protein n=1 Tax=Rousettus aegyptiacus TaxID=9407 RepID=A0A7J8DI25_ROUAE|nr:hypothetical protein HJG63_008587 [Rousettus aegyptiacus]
MTIFVSSSPCPKVNHKSRFTKGLEDFFYLTKSPKRCFRVWGKLLLMCSYIQLPILPVAFSNFSFQFPHQCKQKKAPHPHGRHPQQQDTLPSTFKSQKSVPLLRHVYIPKQHIHLHNIIVSKQKIMNS